MIITRSLKVLANVTILHGRKAFCPAVSKVILSVDGQQVAYASLGGRYTSGQALAEFPKFPGRFTKVKTSPFELAVLAKVA